MTTANSTSSDDQLRRALEAIRRLKSRVAEQESAASPAIAIVGLGLRFPGGVTTPDELWALLESGRDATSNVPGDRWNGAALYNPDPEAPGKISTQRGGFVDAVDQFDPRHFGLAPAEAPHLDPQQRLLLETSWEALENAAIAPDQLTGLAAGVFIGISSSDYAQRLFTRGPDKIDPYVGSGNAHSVAAGRIAYTLGLQGPALAVDTACSSSLVAIHLACQSLQRRECSLALAGGVNLQLSPLISINHSRARMLSPDGRCKAFGDAADGFGRADGCGVVVLKRLADAEQAGDRILAVIRGSATNQDGRTSGLTVPNGRAQQAVIRTALAQARATPDEIDYVEAHGTGTALGDPIEAHALGAVFQERPTDQPLLLGSIKSNFGHCEAAAGIAGLIKVVLALQHESLPPHLHANPPSRRIDWPELPLQITHASRPWPRQPGRARMAGVSSFGFGGTNAHLILAEPPLPGPISEVPAKPNACLGLSARSPAALRQIAADLQTHLADSKARWPDVCFTTAIGRAQLEYRAVVLPSEIHEGLAAIAAGTRQPTTAAERPRVAFQFSGQGSLLPGAGLELQATVPAFRDAFQDASRIVQQHAGWDVAEVLADPDRIARTEFGQVTLFCLGYSLARTWQKWGVEPDVVMGHSVGEYTAACIAGVFSLAEALPLLITRAKHMAALGDHGAMVAVAASPDGLTDSIAATGAEIGAYNTPRQFVLTGNAAAVNACAEQLAAQGHLTTPLRVRQGYHSRDMDPMLDTFRTAALRTTFSSPQCDFISSVTGQHVDPELETADYWVRQIRQPVRWSDAVETLRQDKVDLIIEVGPQGLLTALSQQTWTAAGPVWVASLRGRGDPSELIALRTAAAHAWQHGARLNHAAIYDGDTPRRLALPTYPFQRQRHWVDESPDQAPAYQLESTPVLPAPTESAPRGGHWHLVGQAPGWANELTALGETFVQHDASALPLRLQSHFAQTSGVHRVILAETHPHISAWVGAAKVIALEHPDQWGGLVVTSPATPVAQIMPAYAGTLAAPVIHVVAGRPTAPQLTPDPLPSGRWTARPDVTYLITGGLGALGIQVADWLIKSGAKSLLLLGRRPPSASNQTQISIWSADGIEVRTAAVDITDRNQVQAALASTHRPLGGVVHAAGTPGFERFNTLSPDTWRDTVAAKVTGARWLDELTADCALDLFVLFSSVASVWGSQGQAHYAAANQFLDDLAHRRRTEGQPALSINWGPWAHGGMATPEAIAQLGAIGIAPLEPAAALAGMSAALVAGRTQTVIAQVDWTRFRPVYELRAATHLLGGIPLPGNVNHSASVAPPSPELSEQLQTTAPTERLSVVLQHVQAVVAQVLKLPAGEHVAPHTGFADLGIDSLMAISLRRRLESDLGAELAATLIFDHPDCERLAQHLLAQWSELDATGPVFPVDAGSDDAAAEAELARKLSQLGL